MDAGTVLLIAIPILVGLALLLVLSTTVSRQRTARGALGREARKADRSASTEIDREDWGLMWNVALETGGVLVSKKVTLEIDTQAVLQQAPAAEGKDLANAS